MLSMWSPLEEFHYEQRRYTGPTSHAIVLGPEPSPWPSVLAVRALPLQPIWPGFIINTLLYAALLWLLIYGLALRRFLRLRRRLCPRCAYRMGESAVCTECGTELPERVARVATEVQ